MSESPRLATPVVAVVLEDATGARAEYTVQTDNRDAVRWDMTRARHNWPEGAAAAMLWMTFLAWSALTRAGLGVTPGEKFEDFNNRCLSIRPVKDETGQDLDLEDEDALSVGPTRPAGSDS